MYFTFHDQGHTEDNFIEGAWLQFINRNSQVPVYLFTYLGTNTRVYNIKN